MVPFVTLHAIRRFQDRIANVSFEDSRLELERILGFFDADVGVEGRYVEGVYNGTPYRAVLDARGCCVTVLGQEHFAQTKSQAMRHRRSKQVRKYGYRSRI